MHEKKITYLYIKLMNVSIESLTVI